MYLPILTRYSSVITFFASAELIKKKEGPYGRNRLSSALQTLMRLPFSTFRARSFLRDPLFLKQPYMLTRHYQIFILGIIDIKQFR